MPKSISIDCLHPYTHHDHMQLVTEIVGQLDFSVHQTATPCMNISHFPMFLSP